MNVHARIMWGIVSALVVSALFALPADAAVVPCGKSTDTGVNAMCQTCHLVEAADTALRFVMFVAAPLIATILFIIAGFIRIVGATNTKSISQSKTIFSNAIIGLVVIMLAWMVVNTFLKFVASNYFNTSVKWYEPITCTPDEGVILPSESPTPTTCNPTDLAQRFNTPATARDDPELTTLLACIRGRVGASVNVGSVFTYDQSHPLCNQTRGDRMCGACSHAVNSCHYGGRTGTQGSLAVDYGNEDVGDSIIAAALACGAKSARCETDSGQSVVCSNAAANHVHVSSQSCDAN